MSLLPLLDLETCFTYPIVVGNRARELRQWYHDFSRLEPVDATPIAAAEAQEFFYALQVYGM
jgi:hypothetical protein